MCFVLVVGVPTVKGVVWWSLEKTSFLLLFLSTGHFEGPLCPPSKVNEGVINYRVCTKRRPVEERKDRDRERLYLANDCQEITK